MKRYFVLRTCSVCGEERHVIAGGKDASKVHIRRPCRSCTARLAALSRHDRADVDDVVVLRLTSGRRDTPSTIGERVEATRQLLTYGLSGVRVAERIGVCERTVSRYRRELAA